jgi:predicted permease
LVISLSQTLRGLHWDKIPNDNDEEVGARGILYLLIFQQLGQLLRWSWGYNVLLAPAERFSEDDGGTDISRRLEQGSDRYRDNPDDDSERRLLDTDYDHDYDSELEDDEETRVGESSSGRTSPGAKTPTKYARGSTRSSRSTSPRRLGKSDSSSQLLSAPANGTFLPHENGPITSFPSVDPSKDAEHTRGVKSIIQQFWNSFKAVLSRLGARPQSFGKAVFHSLPNGIQSGAARLCRYFPRFIRGLWEFMNPPLWAMLVAIIVASISPLQALFFDKQSLIYNSVTRAISQSAGVAVPVILVVLGGNLAR